MRIDLDEPLTTAECANWLKLDSRNLLAKVREGKIPAMKLNERVFRFHPRSVLIALRQNGAQPNQD
jgi:hypothetical protein